MLIKEALDFVFFEEDFSLRIEMTTRTFKLIFMLIKEALDFVFFEEDFSLRSK